MSNGLWMLFSLDKRLPDIGQILPKDVCGGGLSRPPPHFILRRWRTSDNDRIYLPSPITCKFNFPICIFASPLYSNLSVVIVHLIRVTCPLGMPAPTNLLHNRSSHSLWCHRSNVRSIVGQWFRASVFCYCVFYVPPLPSCIPSICDRLIDTHSKWEPRS